MQKWWSLFFGVVLGATFVLWLVSPLAGWWLPKNVSTFGPDVDYLFYLILGFTAFFFVLTEALLVYAMYRFAYRPGHKSTYVEGNHRLELAWTLVPAGILLFIAFAQIKAWEIIKYPARMEQPDQVLQVMGRQWEWRFRYPADLDRFDVSTKADERTRRTALTQARHWADVPEIDDLHTTGDLHTWKDARVRIFLKTQDVIHSLYLPNLRLKQDALPGKTIPMWFQAKESNTNFDASRPGDDFCEPPAKDKDWEIACAELCGGGHYRMRGRLYVHPSREDFVAWHTHMKAAQNSHQSDKKEAAVKAP